MIRVYLDSSDFSVMAEPNDSAAQEIRSKLQQHVDNGALEVRFSAIHPMECAHLDGPSKPMALRRIQLIKELCQGKCFRWWSDITLSECLVLATDGHDDGSQSALSDDGHWFPDAMFQIAEGMQDRFVEAIKEMVGKVPISRQQRRQWLRKLISNGKLTRTATDLLAPGREQLLEKLSEELPILRRFFDEDLFLKFATGTGSATEIVAELQRSFEDVEFFVGWAYDRYDTGREMTALLRVFGADLVEKIERMRSEVLELADVGARLGKSSKEVNRVLARVRLPEEDMRRRWLDGIREDNAAVLRGSKISAAIWEKKVIGSRFGSVPSFDSYLEAMVLYFRRNIALSSGPRALLKSDAGDLLHMCYLPYVDIFRCDGEASAVARKVAGRYGTEIVSKLAVLCPVIEQKLANSVNTA